ncbi:MAG: radical SAM protein [Candidatus Alcyoniella australis]|nr:radical SAM protein [Candidatus Alcyoniella australis]
MKLGLLLSREPGDLSWYHPLGLGYLVSYLRAADLDFEPLVTDDVERLIRWNPDVVGISCSSAAYGRAVDHAARIRSRLGVPLIIGGVHISTCPQSLLPVFDLAVIGEGERTLLELLTALRHSGRLQREELRSINGLAWLENGELVETPGRALIDPLDSVPLPDLDALGYTGGPAHVMTSRGCPFKCAFCSSAVHWGGYRSFGAQRVVDELQRLADNYGATEVHIYDDLFTADRKRLEQIAELMDERGLIGRLKLSGAVRADLTDPQLALLLRRMGFERITFGAESCSGPVLKFLKGNVTPEQNQQSVDSASAAGIKTGLSFIVGVPGETREDVLTTYRFISRNMLQRKIDQADVNILAPMPGTQIWQIALDRGLVGPQMNFELLRRPWDGLLLEPSFERHGLEYFRWDRTVRRMVELFGRPIIGLTGFSVSGRESAQDCELLGRILNTLYLISTESRNPQVVKGQGADLVICSCDDWYRTSRELIDKIPEALIVIADDARTLVRDAEQVGRMLWRSHLAGLDLLSSQQICVMSIAALARACDPSPSRLLELVENVDLSGLQIEIFDDQLDIDPFSPSNIDRFEVGEATLSEVLGAYSDGFLEKQRALNLESELRARVAQLEGLIRNGQKQS